MAESNEIDRTTRIESLTKLTGFKKTNWCKDPEENDIEGINKTLFLVPHNESTKCRALYHVLTEEEANRKLRENFNFLLHLETIHKIAEAFHRIGGDKLLEHITPTLYKEPVPLSTVAPDFHDLMISRKDEVLDFMINNPIIDAETTCRGLVLAKEDWIENKCALGSGLLIYWIESKL